MGTTAARLRLASLTLALVLGACATGSRGGDGAAGRPRPSRLGMDDELLPAGLYFRPNQNLEQACPGCPQPRFAGVLGIYGNPQAAERALRAVPRRLLPPGYPWAVLADELMLKDRRASGIVLVVGLVADKKAAGRLAKAWRRRTGKYLRIVELADAKEASRRARRLLKVDAGGDKQPALVQIDPGPAIEAFDEIAFEDRPLADGPKPQPVCRVPPSSLFLFPSKRHLYRFGRARSPARCGKRIVYVPWTRTLNESTVLRRPDGSYRLLQVTGVSCGRPTLEAWSYGRKGRQAKLQVPAPPAAKAAAPGDPKSKSRSKSKSKSPAGDAAAGGPC